MMAQIGLEVHAQLLSARKLFSRAFHNDWSAFDMAWPGSLPVLNANPVIQALRVSLALECKNIHGISTFDRKQYFYHDLPAGYQVTQKHEPIASDGKLRLFPVFDRGIDLEVRIARLQLEQDTMRTTEYSPEFSAVFMEMPRANSPLIEIVTEPDIKNSAEAIEVIRKLSTLLRGLGVSSANMDQGSLRVDVNVSIGKGAPCELKNLVSLKLIQQAIEISRQRELIHNRQTVEPSTRRVEKTTLTTTTNLLRMKENYRDYKIFPDPDIPVLLIAPHISETIGNNLPDLPDATKLLIVREHGLTAQQANILVEQGASSLFIDLIDNLNGDKSGKEIANFIINILLGAKNERGLEIEDLKHRISTKMLVELLQSLNQKTIYYHQAKKIVEFWLNQTKDGLFSISETLQQNPTLAGNVSEPVLEEEIRLVLEQNPKLLKDLQEKPQALNFLCGKVMRKVNGRADPLLLQSVARRVCENDRGPLPT